jgi:hypothetical protein
LDQSNYLANQKQGEVNKKYNLSPPTLSMGTLQKNISHSQVLITDLFPFPTHKTEIGIASRWEATNINPLGLIKLSSQSETGRSQ